MSAEPKFEAPRIVHRLDIDAYHSGPGISNSGLADIDRSPYHFYRWHFDPHRPPRSEKRGQLEGHLAHCAILEPHEFDKRYVVGPSVNRNTKIWKEWVAAHKDRIAIQADQRETAFLQSASVRALPDIADALSKGYPEVGAYWTDPVTGVLCRCRPDWVHEAGAGVVLVDVKTYSDASPGEFRFQVARKGYHRQAAWYSDGYELASGRKVLAFIFVAVEMEWPHAASAVMLDDESLEAGRNLYRRNLDTYARCLERNEWPSYSSAIELVRLPNYALGEQL